MRQEDVRLAIRPRTMLECLDLAFLFCGRHALGLSLVSFAGILPIALLNQWAFTESWLSGYGAYLLLAIEVPWATFLVTLYLGQITFSHRFSTRRAGRDVIRSLPGLFVFQFLIRGLCLLVGILAPFVFVGMYYLNEIVLLEQIPLSKVWKRRSSINADDLGNIVCLRIIDLVILILGTTILWRLFRAISALWEDRFQWDLDLLGEGGFQVDWQLHLAFWFVIVFLTVFRFISYLDCRIRREGWDVELKLRSLAEAYRQREAAE